MNYLVNTDDSQRFLSMASTEAGSRALLGDAEAFPTAAPYMTKAQIEIRAAITKIAALAKDPTRTDVQRHAAARELANRTVETLESAANNIAQQAERMTQGAQAQADSNFAPNIARGQLDSEIRNWIREQAKSPEGMANIKKQAMSNSDVAAVVWHSPDFLLNITPSVSGELRFEVLAKHYPNTYADLSNGVMLGELPKKYANAVRDVRRFFYNPALAEKIALRVEV